MLVCLSVRAYVLAARCPGCAVPATARSVHYPCVFARCPGIACRAAHRAESTANAGAWSAGANCSRTCLSRVCFLSLCAPVPGLLSESVRAWLAQAREAALREQLAAAALEKKQIKAEARSTIAGFREREARVARFQRLAARAARRAPPLPELRPVRQALQPPSALVTPLATGTHSLRTALRRMESCEIGSWCVARGRPLRTYAPDLCFLPYPTTYPRLTLLCMCTVSRWAHTHLTSTARRT